MKRIIEDTNMTDGLSDLLGENVELWCLNYIYAGKLLGVNDNFVLLGDAHLVYETGELNAKKYKDAQPFGREHRIRTHCIESYGLTSKL